ncbi:MAG: XRE family transcriptional regulator [Lachnospiraceae bacterium]|nr:XRE family transcriptional regulator [Lachnospiraceae bacterium]
MAITQFGDFVRILRIKNHEKMGDMALKLKVKVPFLSAVENGKKNVPEDWFEKISTLYNLDLSGKSELEKAIAASKTQVKCDLTNSDLKQRQAALAFARSFKDMDEDTAKRIISILEGDN